MTTKATKILISVLVLICIVLMLAINLIPRNNFIAGPAITLLLYSPLLIIQLFLLGRVWLIKSLNKGTMKFIFYCSLIITIVLIYAFFHFLMTTS